MCKETTIGAILIVTGEQLRAARAMARIEQSDLAERSNVSVDTIKRLERTVGPISANVATMAAVVGALEAAGVEFTNGGQPGVRMKLMQTLERSDYELLMSFFHEGPCELSIGLLGREWAPSLGEALLRVAKLDLAGRSVSSILIPNKASIGAGQILRLLNQLSNRPA